MYLILGAIAYKENSLIGRFMVLLSLRLNPEHKSDDTNNDK